MKSSNTPERSKRPKTGGEPRGPFEPFGLTRKNALIRNIVYWLGFLALWQLAVVITFPQEWANGLRAIFSSMFSAPSQLGSAIFDFAAFCVRSSFSIEVLRHIPVIVLPSILAKNVAARYLTDIFEFELEDTAWLFISRAAFASRYQKITISEGRLAEADRKSPMILIGGPGFVQVNLDSAAVFEKANGSPEVVGPTSRDRVLEGFERLREVDDQQYAIIDLRDQFVRDLSIESRSREGIRIKADDIKILFSVHRNAAATREQPYPFEADAIRSLVYGQVVAVGDAGKKPPAFQWTGTMTRMVQNELGELIASRTLGEILASIGELEVARDSRIQDEITQLTQQIAPGVEVLPESSGPVPDFVSRPKITNQFYDDKFKKRAIDRGVELSWIDIGTWEIAAEIILKNHKEAWQLSKNNAERKASLVQQREEIRTQELIRLIQETATTRFSNLVTSKSAPFTVRDMLVAYHKQLTAASDYYRTHKEPIPPRLARALLYLDKIFEVVPHYVA